MGAETAYIAIAFLENARDRNKDIEQLRLEWDLITEEGKEDTAKGIITWFILNGNWPKKLIIDTHSVDGAHWLLGALNRNAPNTLQIEWIR